MEASQDVGGVGGRCGRRRNCRTCGQQHQPHEPHLYDYIDEVDEDVTCHICLQVCGASSVLPLPPGHLLVRFITFMIACQFGREVHFVLVKCSCFPRDVCALCDCLLPGLYIYSGRPLAACTALFISLAHQAVAVVWLPRASAFIILPDMCARILQVCCR